MYKFLCFFVIHFMRYGDCPVYGDFGRYLGNAQVIVFNDGTPCQEKF